MAIRANAEVILQKPNQWSVESEIPRRLRNSIEIRNQGGTLVIRQRRGKRSLEWEREVLELLSSSP